MFSKCEAEAKNIGRDNIIFEMRDLNATNAVRDLMF